MSGNTGVKLLEQKVPLSYIRLQDVIASLADERRREHKDPVLYGNHYKHVVIEKMEELYQCSFQDVTELTQATQFLHENGILLHYDDVNLQDYYFLDPQWLCDILASVVTIREINSLAKSGMRHVSNVLHCLLCQVLYSCLLVFIARTLRGIVQVVYSCLLVFIACTLRGIVQLGIVVLMLF